MSKLQQLNSRENLFKKFLGRAIEIGEIVSEGIYVCSIPIERFNAIEIAARLYLSKVLTKSSILASEATLLELIKKENFYSIKSLSQSGIILPKKYSCLEYNHLMKCFYEAMDWTGVNVDTWYSTMPLRYKAEERTDYVPGIQYSQTPHLDSWTGFSNYAYAAFMPIFGDFENNFIEFWRPKSGIEESWIDGLKSEDERAEIISNFERVNLKLKPGQIAFADSYVVHNTVVQQGANPRISIDNLFIPSWAADLKHNESIWRAEDRRKHSELCSIGVDIFYDFVDADEVHRSSFGGLKSPAGFDVVNLHKNYTSELN